MDNINNNISLKNIKSKYILKMIFDNIKENIKLNLIRYNKQLQNRLIISINNYKSFLNLELEIIPVENKSGPFINLNDNQKYFNIYFINNKNEIKLKNRNFINKIDDIIKIKVVISKEIKSLKGLFKDCRIIKKINFIKFNRKDITNMSELFNGCSSLEEINFSFIKTDNVIDMSYMFDECTSLKKINLSNFNTSKVTNMNYMFNICLSLEEIIINNFNTSNLESITGMFRFCS